MRHGSNGLRGGLGRAFTKKKSKPSQGKNFCIMLYFISCTI